MVSRRKCFISYHHADQNLVDDFIKRFDHKRDIFIARGLGEEMGGDVIQSTNTDYVMRCIRERYLADSSVTIVFLGACTWARKYVDWEIQASLNSTGSPPNGLLGIRLPNFTRFPRRFLINLCYHERKLDCYARHIDYPQAETALSEAIEAAFLRRSTHGHLIENPRERMTNNLPC